MKPGCCDRALSTTNMTCLCGLTVEETVKLLNVMSSHTQWTQALWSSPVKRLLGRLSIRVMDSPVSHVVVIWPFLGLYGKPSMLG